MKVKNVFASCLPLKRTKDSAQLNSLKYSTVSPSHAASSDTTVAIVSIQDFHLHEYKVKCILPWVNANQLINYA